MHPFIFLLVHNFFFFFCGRAGTYTVTNGQVTCIAKEMVLKRKMSESSDHGQPEPSAPPAS